MLICIHAGKLEKSAVLKAVCSGFEETTEPAVCLSDGRLFDLYGFQDVYGTPSLPIHVKDHNF